MGHGAFPPCSDVFAGPIPANVSSLKSCGVVQTSCRLVLYHRMSQLHVIASMTIKVVVAQQTMNHIDEQTRERP